MSVRIEVVHALSEEQWVLPLELNEGATVEDALVQAARDLVFGRFALDQLTVGIWGEVVERNKPLSDGDRLELLRPLQIDPKTARRIRAKR